MNLDDSQFINDADREEIFAIQPKAKLTLALEARLQSRKAERTRAKTRALGHSTPQCCLMDRTHVN
jgi:hypothetical protein